MSHGGVFSNTGSISLFQDNDELCGNSPYVDRRAVAACQELSHLNLGIGSFAQTWRETMSEWWNADRGWLPYHCLQSNEQSRKWFWLEHNGTSQPTQENDYDVDLESRTKEVLPAAHWVNQWQRKFEPHALYDGAFPCLVEECKNGPNESFLEHAYESAGLADDLCKHWEKPRSWFLNKPRKTVGFHEKVQVVCIYDGEVCDFEVWEDDRECWLRNVWHLHGQIMAWPMLARYSAFISQHALLPRQSPLHLEQSVNEGFRSDVPFFHARQYDDVKMGSFDDTGTWHDCWFEMMQKWIQQERVVTGRKVVTWFLAKDRFHVCVQHRAVSIREGMTPAEFRQDCQQVWQDLMYENDQELAFHFVHPKPPGMPSTLAHVIIVQGSHNNHNFVLYHGDSLPALRRQRAVMFPEGISVRAFFIEAQHPSACQIRNARCFIQHDDGRAQVFLDEEELMRVPNAALVTGAIRVLEQESDDEDVTSNDGETSAASTDVSNDHSLDALSQPSEETQWDEVSSPKSWSWEGNQSDLSLREGDAATLMSGAPVMMQYDNPDPYPWQVDPIHFEEEPEQDMMDTDFAEDHQTQLQEYVEHALEGTETEDTVWQAVTFGIGLLDLGRRDFPFSPLRLNELPELVQQAWWDHAQYGALTIFHVYPQPSELGGINSVVLLVSVASPADLDPDVKNVLITQKGDPAAGLRPVSYGAKILTGSTAKEIMVQLDLHKKCRPFTMRECEVRLGTEVMHEDVRYNFGHGLWCCPSFGRRPNYVTSNMQRVERVEAFYLQVEELLLLRPESDSIVCHVHGVSPENRPMGHRTLVLRRQELEGDQWIERMWQLWPFDHPFAPITFCPYAMPDMNECQEMVFHFAVDYGSRDGVTVLVRQVIQVADDIPKGLPGVQELWAVVMPHMEISEDPLEALERPPFWQRHVRSQNMRMHLQVNGDRYQDVVGQWQDGDVLTMKVNVGQKAQALSILLREGYMPDPNFDELVTEQTSFLQIGATIQHVEVYDQGFQEFCEHVRAKQDCASFGSRADGKGCIRECGGANVDPPSSHSQEKETVRDFQHEPLLRHCHEDNLDLMGCQGNGSVQTTSEAIDRLKHDLSLLYQEDWKGLNHDFEQIPYLHPFARLASQKTQGTSRCQNVFHVFTDGSCKRHKAAWAFVVLCECHTFESPLFYRVGFAAGNVDESIGKVRCNAADAEATAIIAGAEFLLAKAELHNIEVFFHYDAIAVGHGACGSQKIVSQDDSYSDRQRAARILISLLQQRAAGMKGLHVKAHDGHPWNECADSIAGLVCNGWQPPIQAELRSGPLLSNKLREWAWVEANSTAVMPSLEVMLRNDVAAYNQGWVDPTLTSVQEQSASHSDHVGDSNSHNEGCQTHRIRFATANVGTLDYRGNVSCCSIKANELLQQCQQEGIHIFAIQESRAATSRTLTNGPFTRYIAKGSQGQAGVELWINALELSKIFHCDFHPEKDVCIWHCSERILAARCHCGVHTLEIIVFYAPQRGRGAQEQEIWWSYFKSILQGRDKKAQLFMLGDGNCSVGSIDDAAIGSLAADIEDEGGGYLHDICTSESLMIPSTFDQWHNGQSHTFLSAKGGRSRIDFILIPQECAASVVQSFVNLDMDLMNGDRDHFALCLDCEIQVGDKNIVRRFVRQQSYNRNEARKSHSQHDIFSIIDSCPAVDWKTDVNDHWDVIRNHFQKQAKILFPCQQRQQRQLYFSAEAWDVLCNRKDIRKQFRELQREKNKMMLRAIWQVWKSEISAVNEEEDFHLPLHMLRCQEAITYEARLRADKQFRAIKKRDWKNWIRKQLKDKVEAAQGVRSAELFKILRPKQMIARSAGKLLRQLPGLIGQDGEWKSSRDEVAVEWQAQFGGIENAEDISVEELLERSCQQFFGRRTEEDLLQLPTIYQLEGAIRALQADKATGLDGLGAELLQADPCKAAQKIFPLVLKAAIRGQGIMELAGGWLLPLYKGKGNPQKMMGYRAILLESVVSRAISKAWRPKITAGLSLIAEPMQWGGRQGLSIEALHLHIHFWKRNARRKRVSHAVVFLDIRAAFYSVVKQMVAGEARGMRKLEEVFSKIGMSENMKPDFLHQVSGVNLVKQATGSNIVAGNVAAMLGLTWYVIPESKTIQGPMTGSRPGDPSADVLFSLVLTKVLKLIKDRAGEQGIQLHHKATAGDVSDVVTWVDDIAFSLTGEAQQLVSKTMKLLAIVQDTMLEHGLALSYGVGKTAVMFSFHGPGATAARQETEQKYRDGLPLLSEHKGKVNIPIVSHYRHLGGFVVRSGSRLQELRVRTAGAMAKLKPLRSILTHPDLQQEQRSRMVKSLGLSVFTLHAGTLYAMTQGEYQQWQAGIHKIYQSLHQRKHDGEVHHFTLYQLADMMKSPMPMEMIHLCRLRLLAHIIRAGDQHMIAAIIENHEIEQEESWLQGAFYSLRWLAQQVGNENVPDELFQLEDPQVWGWFQEGAHEIKSLIKKAELSHLCKVESFCALQKQANEQDQLLREMGWSCEDEDDSQEKHAISDFSFACDECDAVFDLSSSLAVHQQKKHGKRVALRRVACDATCRACGRFYHTRPRLIKHLQTAKKGCWQYHLRNFEPMTEEEALALDEKDCKAGVAVHQRGLIEHALDHTWRWCTEKEKENGLPLKSQVVRVDGEPTEEEISEWSLLGMLPPGQGGRCQTKRNPTQWSVHNVGHEATDVERKLLDRVQKWSPDPDWIPRGPAEGRRFFLIFFSGHRRFKDLATYIWWKSDLIPICLDVAIDAEVGNILQDSLWRSLIHARRVAGGHAGPPCETYSLARWLENENQLYPRPLRSCEQPWGLDGRTLRETRQWLMGNILMWRALSLLLLIYAYGGSFTLEHPKGCGGVNNKWTIWDSAFVKQLMLAGDIRLWTILQGPLGRPFAKPTNLLAARLEGLGEAIYKGYDKSWRPSMILGGKDGHHWRTAQAKAYPPELCRILAEQHSSFAACQQAEGVTIEPEDLQAALEILANTYDPYMQNAKGTTMCSDYFHKAAREV